MELIDLLKKATGIAANRLRIESPKVVIGDFKEEYVFDSESYEIRLSNTFTKENDELTVVGMTFHEIRHAYQYIQIRFREELKKNKIPVESDETIALWTKEFEIHDSIDDDWSLDIEVDAFAFMTYFMHRVFNVEADLPEDKMKLMQKKLNLFKVIY